MAGRLSSRPSRRELVRNALGAGFGSPSPSRLTASHACGGIERPRARRPSHAAPAGRRQKQRLPCPSMTAPGRDRKPCREELARPRLGRDAAAITAPFLPPLPAVVWPWLPHMRQKQQRGASSVLWAQLARRQMQAQGHCRKPGCERDACMGWPRVSTRAISSSAGSGHGREGNLRTTVGGAVTAPVTARATHD